MAPDVSLAECFGLARAMTFKNAAAGLPHGGAKSVIFADPAMPIAKKEALIRAFARAIRDVVEYIPGPDMGTDERAMAWIKDEIGRVAGLPRELGGIPLDEIGSTGYGLAVAADVAQTFAGVELEGARIAVQGFGAVGKHAARFLAEKGARLVAASDSRGTVMNAKGLDVGKLVSLKSAGKPVTAYKGGDTAGPDAIVGVECDIWIPAARPDVLDATNVKSLRAKLVLQGANIPATAEAEDFMHKHGIVCVPDFIANAGGVITASVEYHGGTEAAARAAIAEKISTNTRAVLEEAKRSRTSPRQAAVALARARIERAMSYRRGHH
jgi:glutamate dehydrogenase (NAD(P)+)